MGMSKTERNTLIAQATSNLKGLLSQYEAMSVAKKNEDKPRNTGARNIKAAAAAAAASTPNKECEGAVVVDDGIFSSNYDCADDDDEGASSALEDFSKEEASSPMPTTTTTHSTPAAENYFEISATNPYDGDGDAGTLTAMGALARRIETIEETLARLEKDLELAHRRIEEDCEVVLQWLMRPLEAI